MKLKFYLHLGKSLKKGNNIQIKPLDRENALSEAKSLFSIDLYEDALDMDPEKRLTAYNKIKEVIKFYFLNKTKCFVLLLSLYSILIYGLMKYVKIK